MLAKAIQELSAKVEGIISWFSVRDNNLCIDDVCVTKDQFKQILINGGATQTQPAAAALPSVEPTPEPSSEEVVVEEPVTTPALEETVPAEPVVTPEVSETE